MTKLWWFYRQPRTANSRWFELFCCVLPKRPSSLKLARGSFGFFRVTHGVLVVEVERFELTTSRLQSERSPTELHPRDQAVGV
jgi:hypothetical protein